MALTRTTVSTTIPLGASDLTVTLASVTGLSAGMFIQLQQQETVRVSKAYTAGNTQVILDGRGLEGTVSQAWPIRTPAVFGTASDFAEAGYQLNGATALAGRGKYFYTYSAAGAIALPVAGTDNVAFLTGTAAAFTVAAPSVDMDGCELTIVNVTAAAHTVTFTGGLGGVGATADVLTFKADQTQAIEVIAANQLWCLKGAVAGAATIAGAGIA